MAAQFSPLLANAKNKSLLKRAAHFLSYVAAPRKCGAARNRVPGFRCSLQSSGRHTYWAAVNIPA